MITLIVEDIEQYDNGLEEFVYTKGGKFRFENSLESISLWESKWELPFFNTNMTNEQLMSYYSFMCVDEGFKKEHLTPEVTEELSDYLAKPCTATIIQNDDNSPSGGRVMTSETVYALMASAQVPFSCDKWNINRLMMVLRIIAENQKEPKKMSQKDIIEQNRKLNEERKKKLKTKG